MRPIALALAAALAAGPARTEEACWLLGCDDVSRGEAAAALLRHDLGGPLPPGTKVVGLLQGGFQDRFVQARLSVEEADLPALLATLRVSEADLAPTDAPYLGPSAPAWFDWEAREGLRVGNGWTGTLAHVTVAVAPDRADPNRWVVYLWGFQA
jgi:hypothetical protein